MKRTYENAMKILETRRRKGRPKTTTGELPNNGGAAKLGGVPSLVGMKEWLQVLGHSDGDLNHLNVIHVAGTKGKGSTCAFARSFLLAHGNRTGYPRKIGLYTSPDLRSIRERIQINDQPILEEAFTRYFFDVWERLSAHVAPSVGEGERLPRYLQLLALMAFHCFIKERVNVTILETHHGGEYDSTNVIREPIVTGITAIGLDHVAQLGPSIENIAWHKAGIFKPGTPAFSAPQEPVPASVLGTRAAEKSVKLHFVDSEVNEPLLVDSRILKVDVQKANCSLALALVNAFLERKAPEHGHLTSDDICRGVEGFAWPGRFETIIDGSNQWFLDGAHNELSVDQAAKWFANSISGDQDVPRILIFTHYSSERDGGSLLQRLAKSLLGLGIRPHYVIFTTYQEREDGSTRIDKAFKAPKAPFPELLAMYSSIWASVDAEAKIISQQSIEGALNVAREISEQNGMRTLITGSLGLVGGALSILRPYQ